MVHSPEVKLTQSYALSLGVHTDTSNVKRLAVILSDAGANTVGIAVVDEPDIQRLQADISVLHAAILGQNQRGTETLQ